MEFTQYNLILTDNCNLRCTYCFDNLYSDRTCFSNTREMSEDMIPNIISFIEQTRSKKEETLINMFGGEPLVNWNFFKKFVEVFDGYAHFPHRFISTVNGTLLNTEKLDFFNNHNVSIAISLDGTEESNSARVTINGQPTWNKIVHILPEAKAKLPDTVLLMTIGKHNYQHVYESCRFFNKLEFHYNINWNMEENYTEEELLSVETQLKRIKKEKMVLPNSITREFTNKDCNSQSKDGTVCKPADKAITIAPNGKLYFCHQFVPKMTDTEDLSYGNIKDGITDKELYQIFVDRSYFFSWSEGKDIECNKCSVKDTCRGGCMAVQWHRTKDYLKMNPSVCDFSKLTSNVMKGIK